MSVDIVDDLQHAEDLLGGAGLLEDYCRPSCGEAEDRASCADDCCGCPCHSDSAFNADTQTWEPIE